MPKYWVLDEWHACKAQRLMSPRSQPPGWERILNGLLPLAKKEEAAALREMVSQPGGWEPVEARAVS